MWVFLPCFDSTSHAQLMLSFRKRAAPVKSRLSDTNSSEATPTSEPRPPSAWVCGSICVGAFLVLYLLVDPAWEDTDDVRMMMIAAAIDDDGESSELLVYMNLVVGHALSWLCRWVPSLAWYSVFLVSLHVVSQTAICYCLSRMAPRLLWFFGCFQFATATYLWTHLQFTTTAGITTLAGASLLFCSVRFGSSTRQLCLAWCLIVVGSLVRFESAGLVGVLTIPTIAVLAWRHRASTRWKQHFVVGGIAMALIASSVALDSNAYESDPQWREFRRVSRAVAVIVNDVQYKLQLNSNAGGDELVTAIERAGISRVEQRAMCLWVYSDRQGCFSIDRLRSAARALRDSKSTHQLPRFAAISAIQLLHSNFFMLVFGTSLAFVAFSSSHSTGSIAIPTAFHSRSHFTWQWLYFLVVMTYIHWNMKLPARVYLTGGLTCLISTITVATSPSTRRFQLQSSPKFPNILVILAIIGSGWIVFESVSHSRQFARERLTVEADLMKQLSADYTTVLAVPYPFDRLHPFDNLNWLRNRSYVYLDGHQRSPRERSLRSESPLRFYLSDTSKRLGVEPHVRQQFGELEQLTRGEFGTIYSLKSETVATLGE